jgi:hypothetical protein
MDRIPAGILSIPAEFLESVGFRRNSWIPPDSMDSGRNQWGNEKYCSHDISYDNHMMDFSR